MKIITSQSVYVQKNDLGFLNRTDIPIPASIFLTAFGGGTTIIDGSNRFDFVQFDGEEAIEYFRNLDWIVDYDSVKDLDDFALIEKIHGVVEQRNEIVVKYNSMSNNKRKENTRMVEESELLDFKRSSLCEILWFKRGQLNFKLPKGIGQTEYSSKKAKFQKILKRFKKEDTNS